MAKVKVIGIDSFINAIQTTADGMKEICGEAVYQGASIVADTVKAEIDTIPDREKVDGELARGITPVERAGLKYGFGISRMRNSSGFWNVKIGFDGYNLAGKANAMIARSYESGTSWLKKDAFISRGVKKSESRAEAKMTDAFEKEIKKRTN